MERFDEKQIWRENEREREKEKDGEREREVLYYDDFVFELIGVVCFFYIVQFVIV